MKYDVIILGCGVAGLATAFHLSKRPGLSILMLEQEIGAAQHSSGQNAAIARSLAEEDSFTEFTSVGVDFLRNPAKYENKVPGKESFIQRNGLVLTGKEDQLLSLSKKDPFDLSEMIDSKEAKKRFDSLEGTDFGAALWCPQDGTIDIHDLVSFYRQSALDNGVKINFLSRADFIEYSSGSFQINTPEQKVESSVLVNASGAFANKVNALLGIKGLTYFPRRRHLHICNYEGLNFKGWPVFWNIEKHFYYRPEGDGLLVCSCDQDLIDDSFLGEDFREQINGGSFLIHPDSHEWLAEKMEQYCPYLFRFSLARTWSGLRTFSESSRPVIDWSKEHSSLYNVLGLGGHGMSASYAVGKKAASDIQKFFF